MKRALLAGLVLACCGGFAAPAFAGPVIDRAVEALRDDPVYVDPGAGAVSEDEAEAFRQRIEASDAGPLYIAILPGSAAREAGGDPDEVLREIATTLRRPGTYAAVVGNRFSAGASSSDILPRGRAAQLVREALAAAPRRRRGGDGVGLHRPRRAGQGKWEWGWR